MDLGWKRLIPLTLGWLLLVAGIIAWGWAGLWLLPVVILASFCSSGPTNSATAASDEDIVLPVIGGRVTRAPRLSSVPDPVSGGKA